MQRPSISIVTTLYRSRPFLPDFLEKVRAAIDQAGFSSSELIFVNDGSPDDSLAFLRVEQAKDPRIRLVDLSRNFGHHYAAHAGLGVSTGELVYLTDCDLEVDPGLLPGFLGTLREQEAEVVYGYIEVRKGGALERAGGKVFWKSFNWLSDTPVPENITTERLMTRAYVDALLSLGDKNLFLAGMMYWTGFRQIGIPVTKNTRTTRSTYTPIRRFKLMVNAITSFSAKPLSLLFYSGLIVSLVSFAIISFLVIQKLVYKDQISVGWTSIISLIFLMFGILVTAIGVIGIYLSKMFVQNQNRPLYIIRKIY